MEPFELALSQVNFEGNDLSGSGSGQPLHSFSNLVSYDSDFKDSASAELPISARRVHMNADTDVAVGNATVQLAASFYQSYTRPHNGGPHAHAHLVNGSDSVTVEPDESAKFYYRANKMENPSPSSGSPHRKADVIDSFRGFTETVEALALQKSVIGNSRITPASAEEVARVIAQTQMKLKDGDSETESDISTTQPSTDSASISFSERTTMERVVHSHTSTTVVHDSPVLSHTECSTATNLAAIMSARGVSTSSGEHISSLVPGPHGVHAAAILPAIPMEDKDDATHSTMSQEDATSTEPSSSELIPIPQGMITKVTEKKGWLTGRSAISPEQSRPKERLGFGDDSLSTKHWMTTSETADKDFSRGSHAGQENADDLNVQCPPEEPPTGAQSESVISAGNEPLVIIANSEQLGAVPGVHADTAGQGPDKSVVLGLAETLTRSITGVDKLKGEYDFDTSSYLETMETFTSLPKTNGVLVGEESGTARFSPPVKDPGMLATDRFRAADGKDRTKSDHNSERAKEELQEADENLTIPFHMPVDASTPCKPQSRHGNITHVREQKRSRASKSKVRFEETVDHVVSQTYFNDEAIQQYGSSSRLVHKNDDLIDLDLDITDHTSQSRNNSINICSTSSHNTSNVINTVSESASNSMVVNVDEVSRIRSDDMMGDLSLGNSSAAAGEGADLNKSERVDYYNLQEEVVKLRREKAHLEGKMEVLETEATTAIKERSELQSHLAAITTHLKSQENSNKMVVADRNALAADLETLKQNRQRLELVVMDAQKLIEEKDQDIKTLHEDLKLSHAANEKVAEKVKEHRHELLAKDETIQVLKNKVAELYVEYQNSHQMRLLADNEIKSLESSVSSLTSAKEWYQAQLQQSQDAKGQLQQEIMRIQSESITSVTLVERLKADNVRIKQNLADQQQRALQEKEMLARHLEAIESDMMERETAFSQMQQEQVAMEAAMRTEEERVRVVESDTTNSEDLKKLQNDLRRKHAQVNVLEHEQSTLVKRLTLAQESLLERDRTIDGLDQKYVDIELSYKNLQRELDGRDEEVLRLKNEKNAVDIELTSTKEEKKTFDVALHTIKDDMGKVEHGFRQLKQELTGRTEELQQEKGRSAYLDHQLAATRARLRVLTHRSTPQHAGSSQGNNADTTGTVYDHAPVHHEDKSEEELIVQIVQKPDEGSKPEVVILTQTCVAATPDQSANGSAAITELDNAVIQQLQAQRGQLELRVEQLSAQNSQLRESVTMQGSLRDQLGVVTQRLEAVSEQLRVVMEERGVADGLLVQSREQLVEMELNMRTLSEERDALKQTLGEERARLEGEAASATLDAVEEREAIAQLGKENAMLRAKVSETEKQLSREVNKLRAKVLEVTEDYEARLDEERSRQVDYQAAISELNKRLRATEQIKDQLSAELTTSEQRFNLSLDEQKQQVQEQTQALSRERAEVEASQRVVRVQLEEVQASLLVREETIDILRTKIMEIEIQNREARESLEESERLRKEEDARHLSLDLEREKGRLAGVLQSHSALKEHTTSLEAALARREASVAGLSTHVQGELQKRDKQVHDLREQVKELEGDVIKEKQNVKDIKKQLLTEKGQHIKLRRQMETLWVDQDQVKVDLQTRTNDLNLTTLDYEKTKHINATLKAEVDRLGVEGRQHRVELEAIRRDLLEREQRDPLLNEQIQTLEWHLQQKSLEADSLREQLRLVGERQTMEVESLNKALLAANNDLTAMKEEMLTLRQDKMTLTSKVSQIKTALKASASHNKKRREKQEAELTKTQPAPFDMAALEKLLQDTAPVIVQSKPLSFLKATLSGLRGEISNLQHQVDQHTSAMQTSSEAWKQLEGHVHDLREVCKTSAAGRAASGSITSADEEAPAPCHLSSEPVSASPVPVSVSPVAVSTSSVPISASPEPDSVSPPPNAQPHKGPSHTPTQSAGTTPIVDV